MGASESGGRGGRGNPRRREQILQAAAAVFAERGIHRARMDDIVAASGLSKGSLYWYFTSKDELISGLVEPVFTAGLDQLRALTHESGTVTERLTGFVDRYAGLVVADSRIPVLTVEFYAFSLRNDAVRDRLRAYYADATDLLADLVGQGRCSGEFDAGTDSRAAGGALMSTMEGATLLWTLAPDGELADALRTPLNLYLRGLRHPA